MTAGLQAMVKKMTTTFKIVIHDRFKTATRPNGVSARQFILKKFEDYEKIDLDFTNENPTPSFVDECIGLLICELGWSEFKQRVQITNPSDSARSLIKLVISRRKAQAMDTAHA